MAETFPFKRVRALRYRFLPPADVLKSIIKGLGIIYKQIFEKAVVIFCHYCK